jgi:hypothetical protein
MLLVILTRSTMLSLNREEFSMEPILTVLDPYVFIQLENTLQLQKKEHHQTFISMSGLVLSFIEYAKKVLKRHMLILSSLRLVPNSHL